MKRPSIKIAGRPASPSEVHEKVGEASRQWLRDRREQKEPSTKRRHRALSIEQREAKAQATAQARKTRKDQREAREMERWLMRVGYLSRRSQREADAMTRVQVRWRPGTAPVLKSTCSRSLYARLHPDISARTTAAMTRSRVSTDGFRNIVLRKIPRGYGRKAPGTRAYRSGEAGDLVRYMLRDGALEPGISACFTNVIEMDGDNTVREASGTMAHLQDVSAMVGFWKALEAFEAEADSSGNVYSHIIMAMPHELSPDGRSEALEDFCFRLDALQFPFVAALHQPDPDGDIRNFHAHLIVSPRPFAIDGDHAWSFEAGKAAEFNLPAGIHWLREQAAAAFNHALDRENNSTRYSGLSQARRGVTATADTHDGPARTARKRSDEQDRAKQDRLLHGLVAHVARAARTHDELDARIEAEAGRTAVDREPSTQTLPPAVEAIRARYPDPLRLKGLSIVDFVDYTSADHAADKWYWPAIELRGRLDSYKVTIVRERDGIPEIIQDDLEPLEREILSRDTLPDIVSEALLAAHGRFLAEQDRLLAEKESEERHERFKRKVRAERLKWLRGEPRLLFGDRLKVLKEYEDYFPRHVMELDGVKDAMIQCHMAAINLEHAKRDAEKAAQEKAKGQVVTNDALEAGVGSPSPATQALPEAGSPAPSPDVPESKESEDADWDLQRAAFLAGKLKTPSGKVPEK